MIYVVSSQQDLHLSQFFKVLELMGFPWAKDLVHVNYGLVQGMSTRKGTVVFLNEIIKEAGNVMHEQMQKNEEKYNAVVDPEETALEIGITGVGAAVANAVYNATGKRIRELPITLDKLM